MISVFQHTDFRDFVRAYFKSLPKSGYGQSRRLAEFLGVHTTLVSQILLGKKSLSAEQALRVCEFFSFSELETDYFLLLTQLDRSGTESLRSYLTKKLEALRKKSQDLVNRLPSEGKLSDEQRALFYSDWIYSAVWQMTAIKNFHSVEAIADRFDLPRKRVREVANFLLSTGLCKEVNNRLSVGTTAIHLEASSPWIRVHHLNWRQKGLEALQREGHAGLHYSSPLTVSREDAERIREMIAKFLESVSKVVAPSPSEELRCLNVDWFEVD